MSRAFSGLRPSDKCWKEYYDRLTKIYSCISKKIKSSDAKENGILHMETSAKNANNVKSLFVEIAKTLPKTVQPPDREAFPIMPQKQEPRNCC